MFGIDEIRFLQPSRIWWLIGALVLVIAYLWTSKRTVAKVEKRLPTLDLLEQAERKVGNRWRRWLPVLFAVLALSALFTHWATPVVTAQVRQPARIVIALDTSDSSNAIETEGGLTRIERMQAEALEIVESAKEGDELALVVFADEAIQSVPPTTDKAKLVAVIEELESEVETDLGGALLEAHRLARLAPATSHVILMSDGAATTSTSVELALEQLKTDEVLVSTFLVGSRSGFSMTDEGLRRPFPARPELMNRIADETGGIPITEASEESLLDQAYELIDRDAARFVTETRPVEWLFYVALAFVGLAAAAYLWTHKTRFSR